MTLPSWELSVLSRSVQYPNLSGAAGHVGLSQPQLSRIVKRLEDELNVELLDRRVRKLAAWTPEARELARLWSRNVKLFEAELRDLSKSGVEAPKPKSFQLGTEPGLVPAASELAHFLFESFGVAKIDLDVLSPQELEGACLRGDLHFACISRQPRRSVSRFSLRLGWQILAPAGETARVRVLARDESRETGLGERTSRSRGRDPNFRLLVSDSFDVRRHWIEERGAGGWIPTGLSPEDAKQRKGKRAGAGPKKGRKEPVLLLASKAVDSKLWNVVASEFHL